MKLLTGFTSFKRLCAVFASVLILSGCGDNRTPAQLSDALLKAAGEGNLSEVKSLIQKGADVNGEGHPSGDRPLRAAAVNGHVQCVKVLLDDGADPSRTVQGGSIIARPLVSVQAALSLLREAKKTPPALLHPALKQSLDRGVSVETYEEIIGILEKAGKDKSK